MKGFHASVIAPSWFVGTLRYEIWVAVKRKILIVEDERDLRDLLRFHLEQEGYAVCEADAGDTGLAAVATERPALVVLDLMLPGTDGLEICRRH